MNSFFQNPVAVTLAVVALLVLAFLIWMIYDGNRMRHLRIKVQEASSGIDVALTKRFDLLTKALEAVKGYRDHEREVLLHTVQARNEASASGRAKQRADDWEQAIRQLEEAGIKMSPVLPQMDMASRQRAVMAMNEVSGQIHALAENYPYLRAVESFWHLQNSINDVEEHLQAARRLYNANVSAYNRMIVTFPHNFVYRQPLPFFEADTFKRNDIEIKF